jgi:hypothetical protein
MLIIALIRNRIKGSGSTTHDWPHLLPRNVNAAVQSAAGRSIQKAFALEQGFDLGLPAAEPLVEHHGVF